VADKLSKDRLNQIKNEIIMAEKVNEDRLLPQMIEALERYTGKHVPIIAADWDIVLNEIYPIIQYELPSTFFRNPRVFLKPRNKNYFAKVRNPVTGVLEETVMDSAKSAKTQESILNYSLQEIRYKQEVRKTLMDALLFKHGVLWHGYKGEFGMTDEQSLYIKNEMVFVKRLSPMNFVFDPAVSLSNLDEARWIGRSFDVPLDDLVEDDSLDVDKKALKGQLGYANKMESIDQARNMVAGKDTIVIGSKSKTLIDYTDGEYQKGTHSKFVRVYEIFMRPTKKERKERVNGHLLLYTKEQEKPLRENSWPYKAEGWPGKVLMFNDVPDSMFGLSDIEVYGHIADQKNMVVNLQLRDAQENSKVWVGYDREGLNQEDVEKIQSGQQTIIGFDGNPQQKLVIASPGGAASAPLYTLDQRIQTNLDEKSGVSDLKKGTLRSGEESATSVRERMAGSSARPAYRQDIMADFLKDSCHFLNQLLKQYLPVKDAVRIVGSLDIEWSENPTKEAVQADVDVDIDVISMAPENPEKEIQELTTILNLMINAIQNPAIFQKIQQEGKTFNFAPVIENLLMRLRIRDPEVFRNIRPEESQGFVSVAEVRAAKDNVNAALAGSQPPSPPQPGQDHRARLEMYTEIMNILQAAGGEGTLAVQLLQQLIELQTALLQEEEQKESPRPDSKVNFSESFVTPMGAK